MATGLEMFDALQRAAQGLPTGSDFRMHYFDQFDLFKLKPEELVARGYDQLSAERISTDLMAKCLDELGKSLGIKLFVARDVRTLIPGEGARRAAEALRDDPQTLEEMLIEMDRIRHPEELPR